MSMTQACRSNWKPSTSGSAASSTVPVGVGVSVPLRVTHCQTPKTRPKVNSGAPATMNAPTAEKSHRK